MGGRKATTDESAWSTHAVLIADELKAVKVKFLIAETADGPSASDSLEPE
jgi:hypothetical protein